MRKTVKGARGKVVKRVSEEEVNRLSGPITGPEMHQSTKKLHQW